MNGDRRPGVTRDLQPDRSPFSCDLYCHKILSASIGQCQQTQCRCCKTQQESRKPAAVTPDAQVKLTNPQTDSPSSGVFRQRLRCSGGWSWRWRRWRRVSLRVGHPALWCSFQKLCPTPQRPHHQPLQQLTAGRTDQLWNPLPLSLNASPDMFCLVKPNSVQKSADLMVTCILKAFHTWPGWPKDTQSKPHGSCIN